MSIAVVFVVPIREPHRFAANRKERAMPTMPENNLGQGPGEPSGLGQPGQMSSGYSAPVPGQMSGGPGPGPGRMPGGQMSGAGSMPGQMSDPLPMGGRDPSRPLSGQMSAEMPMERNSGQDLPASGKRAEDLIQRVVQGAHETVDRIAAKAVPAVERLRTGATDTKGTLQAQATRAKEVSGEWTESLRGTVRQHPLASIAIAAVVGMLYSRLRSRD
jgi:ElaB/YqjD/DUF883 family membrane-anchored ribosome-binding protein